MKYLMDLLKAPFSPFFRR